MKPLFRFLVKLLYVAVLPVSVLLAFINLLIGYELTIPFIVLGAIIVIITVFNAIFYTIHMKNTFLLPEVTVEFVPVFGIAIGAMKYGDSDYRWIILLPFCSIEFRSKK